MNAAAQLLAWSLITAGAHVVARQYGPAAAIILARQPGMLLAAGLCAVSAYAGAVAEVGRG